MSKMMTIAKKRKIELVDKTGNQINVIYPYRTRGGWSFDDKEVGLQGEPFVAGIPKIIDSIVGKRKKFTAYISKDPIPDYTAQLEKLDIIDKEFRNLVGEGWYQLVGTPMLGWLCPATLKYFKDYPDNIYFKIE
jgi:hypothetical protein